MMIILGLIRIRDLVRAIRDGARAHKDMTDVESVFPL
jgi:hypothetical protein